MDRVSTVLRAAVAAAPPPVAVAVDNEPSSSLTRLTVRSADTPGFLFAFSNALAGFTINIERAEVGTLHGEAVDTFWVTDVAGRPIRDEGRIHELRVATALVKQFTHLLRHSPDPGQASASSSRSSASCWRGRTGPPRWPTSSPPASWRRSPG